MKKNTIILFITLLLVACSNKESLNFDNYIYTKEKQNSPININVGVLHNKGLDILLEAITPLYKSKDSVFSNYMCAFAKNVDHLTYIASGYLCAFDELKETYFKFSSAEDVDDYILSLKKNISKEGIVGEIYNEIIENLKKLGEDPHCYSNTISEQVFIIDNMCQYVNEKYYEKCKTELDRFCLKTMTEVCLYSFVYWSDHKKMDEWEQSIQYAAKSDKKKEKKKKKKDDKSVWQKVGEFVAADVVGAAAGATAGSVLPGVGTTCGAIAVGSCSSGAIASAW